MLHKHANRTWSLLNITLIVAFLLLGWTGAGSAIAASPAESEPTWLIMMYQDADDDVLEEDIFTDLNEMEVVGSTDNVHIVSQIDRYVGAFDGGGDWTTTKRYYVTQDGDMFNLASEEIEDLGETAMSDGNTLVDFITWAAGQYPADKYVLILSDHGAGWPGGWNDPDPEGPGAHDVPLAQDGDQLFLMELDEALGRAREQAGIDQFEMIGFDACLMGHLEVYAALTPHARYAVASQETEPSLGWAYASFLRALTDNPSMSGAELAQAIVESYIFEDYRVLDPRARAGMLLQLSDLTPEEIEQVRAELSQASDEEIATLEAQIPAAEDFIQARAQDITLSAVDLSAIPSVIDAVGQLAQALQAVDQNKVAEARTYAQSFTSIFGDNVPPSYIDLGNFAMILQQNVGDENVSAAIDNLLAAMQQAILAEKHGPEKPGATGISIYFPNSNLISAPMSGYTSYVTIADRFAAESLWDDFLVFHYTGQPVPEAPQPIAEAVTPGAGEPYVPMFGEIIAPGASQIQIAPLELSAEETNLDNPLTITTQIEGQNIGYIYLFVGLYDEENNAMLVADMDYVMGDTHKDVNGVIYPDWGSEPSFPLDFEWSPELYSISDGATSEFALLNPQTYGKTSEEDVYAVSGIYKFARGGNPRYAELYFSGEGKLRQVYGYANIEGTGAPREITPQPGDQFTILEEWIDLSEESEEAEFYTVEGGTLTFSNKELTWEAIPAPPGQYEVGFIAEDYDGNSYEEYASVVVTD